jgi:hypothetical protein
VVRAAGDTGQIKLERNDTHYQLLLSLAALERITCGGFCAGFEPPPSHPEEQRCSEGGPLAASSAPRPAS